MKLYDGSFINGSPAAGQETQAAASAQVAAFTYSGKNPVKAGLCKYPEEYKYSSAKFYFESTDEFGLFIWSF